MQESNKAKYLLAKRMLNIWGTAPQICKEKTKRIIELKELCKNNGDIQSVLLKDVPQKKASGASRVERSVIKTVDVYEKTIIKLENDISDILEIKSLIDSWISFQPPEEQKIMVLRYCDGLSWDYIPEIIHKSRMQCFRIHNRVLERISDERPWAP